MWHSDDGASEVGVLRSLARVLVPVACPGCGLPDVRWCEACAAPWWELPFRSEAGAGRLDVEGRPAFPVWSILPLEGPAHRMISAWKDGRRRDLDPFFRDAMTRAGRVVAEPLAVVDAVVPVPSRPSSLRRRGADLTGTLAKAAAKGLAAGGDAPSVREILVHRGRESSAMGSRERWLNAGAGIHVRRLAGLPRAVVLIDDVVTTGATLARAVEALEGEGVAVAAALTLAATPRRNPGPQSPR